MTRGIIIIMQSRSGKAAIAKMLSELPTPEQRQKAYDDFAAAIAKVGMSAMQAGEAFAKIAKSFEAQKQSQITFEKRSVIPDRFNRSNRNFKR